MRGNDAVGATSREQLLALAQRRGQAEKTLALFVSEAATAVRNGSAKTTPLPALVLLNAAVVRRLASWTQALSAERDHKRQRVSSSEKQDVLFAAKMAQRAVKAYASTTAAAVKEEELKDLVAAMDLACVALYVVCALEHAVQLGDMVVDNLLYQVAKKYAEIPSRREAAICVAASVHVRLWNAQAKLYRETITKSQLMASLYLQEEADSKIAATVQQKLELLAEFPRPRSCHTAQFARLLLGHTNVCITLLTAAKRHEAILLVVGTTLSPWIAHLQKLPGENSKFASLFSDRAFRILWKCAAATDSTGQKSPESASAALRFRSTALTFLLKCSNYTSSYFIQQVHRVGVQHERASRRSQLGLKELYAFYTCSANALTQTIPNSPHTYSSDALQWEYIQWLEHFALICEASGMHLKGAMILKSAVQYVQLFGSIGEPIQLCLLFSVVGDLFSAASSEKREKWPTESSKSPFDKRLEYDSGRIIGDLIHRASSGTLLNQCEKAARVYLKKLEALTPYRFASLAAQDLAIFVPFLTRCLKRGSTKIFNYAISVQHSSKYQLYTQIVASFGEMCKAVQGLRAASVIKDRNIVESLLLEESRLHRMTVMLLVRCCTEDSSMVAQPCLRDLSHHVNLVQMLLDESTMDGKLSESILQGVLGDLNAIARECYNCATQFYKAGNCQDTISALIGAFELAERYLEYVMCSNLTYEDVHKAHTQLKVDAIVSLLAHCFRELEDFTKSRIFIGYSILYCGDINERIPQANVDKFVSCILEEVKLPENDTGLTLVGEFKVFLDNASHVFKARYIPDDQIARLWNAFRVTFERSSANIVTSMRARDCVKSESGTNIDEIAVRLCCSLENYMEGVLMKLRNMPSCCDCYDTLLDISLSLATRKQIYFDFYARNSYGDAIERLLLVHRSLSNAVEELRHFSGAASSDLGGVYGWLGVITMEIALMVCYAQECGIAGDASISEENAIADIERCLMYWSECGETSGFLFDGSRIICCLESVCNTLSLISCSVLEKTARKLLKTFQLSASGHDSTLGVVPPALLSMLDVNDECNVTIKEPGAVFSSAASISAQMQQFEQVDREICAAGTSNFDDNIAQACQHLLLAITTLGDIRHNIKLRPTATIAKAIGMRELFARTILSDIYFREGRSKCAIAEAKVALRICWKLAKKFGVASSSAEVGYFELPPEISSAECQPAQVLFFKALECTSWDLLSAAKQILCQIASLYSLSDQPHRASYYLKEAMRLVGGLNLRFFPRKPFYEFAELELNASHVKEAKVAISLLNPTAGPSMQFSNNDHAIDAAASKLHSCIQSDPIFLEQICNEIVQQGDVHRSEREEQVALSYYAEAIEVLSAVDHSENSASKILTGVKARCWRKYAGLQSQIIDFTDSAAIEELLASMKMLKRSMKACDACLERVKCMLQLGRINTRLLRSTSTRAFTSLERTLALLEEAFLLGGRLGIPYLSQELRTALGMAYFAEIEENARNAVDLMDGGDRDNFLLWASSSLLANAGTADVAEAELATAETDSDISMKEGLVMQLERLAAIPAVSLKPNSQLAGMARTVAEKIRQLPDTWIIVSLMIGLQSELVISRIPTTGAAPISFCLPKVAWMKCMHEMDAIIQESRKILSGHTAEEADLWSTELKKKWWSTRKLLDERIEKAVLCMQETLGFWRCLLVKNTNMYSGQVVQSCWNILASSKLGSIRLAERNLTLLSAVTDAQYWLSDSEVIDALHHIAAEIEAPMPDSIAQEILQLIRSAGQHSTEAIDSGHVSNLSKLSTERIAKMKVSEVKQLLVTEGLSTDGLKKVLVGRLIAARDAALLEELTLQARGGSQECSTILILNHQLQQFPWEGMDVMGSSTGVTRMPSLDLILQNAGRASPVTRVRRNRVRFLLNPAGDLKSTQNQLGPILEGGTTTYGWEGVVGEIPGPDELREYLLAADLYIYCGHGSGEAYLHRDKVMSLQSDCSAALLFGCSSGRLERQGIFGPSGAVLAYLRAGSPAVLAMLWDVTDRDIDQLSVKVLQEWLLADPEDESDSRSLAQVLQGSRGVCKLKYLNGHAAVCYGLPLHVTKC